MGEVVGPAEAGVYGGGEEAQVGPELAQEGLGGRPAAAAEAGVHGALEVGEGPVGIDGALEEGLEVGPRAGVAQWAGGHRGRRPAVAGGVCRTSRQTPWPLRSQGKTWVRQTPRGCAGSARAARGVDMGVVCVWVPGIRERKWHDKMADDDAAASDGIPSTHSSDSTVVLHNVDAILSELLQDVAEEDVRHMVDCLKVVMEDLKPLSKWSTVAEFRTEWAREREILERCQALLGLVQTPVGDPDVISIVLGALSQRYPQGFTSTAGLRARLDRDHRVWSDGQRICEIVEDAPPDVLTHVAQSLETRHRGTIHTLDTFLQSWRQDRLIVAECDRLWTRVAAASRDAQVRQGLLQRLTVVFQATMTTAPGRWTEGSDADFPAKVARDLQILADMEGPWSTLAPDAAVRARELDRLRVWHQLPGRLPGLPWWSVAPEAFEQRVHEDLEGATRLYALVSEAHRPLADESLQALGRLLPTTDPDWSDLPRFVQDVLADREWARELRGQGLDATRIRDLLQRRPAVPPPPPSPQQPSPLPPEQRALLDVLLAEGKVQNVVDLRTRLGVADALRLGSRLPAGWPTNATEVGPFLLAVHRWMESHTECEGTIEELRPGPLCVCVCAHGGPPPRTQLQAASERARKRAREWAEAAVVAPSQQRQRTSEPVVVDPVRAERFLQAVWEDQQRGWDRFIALYLSLAAERERVSDLEGARSLLDRVCRDLSAVIAL